LVIICVLSLPLGPFVGFLSISPAFLSTSSLSFCLLVCLLISPLFLTQLL
jgi:hypothetical protein